MGAVEGSQEPFLLEGQVPFLTSFIWRMYESTELTQKCYWILKTWLFLFNYYLPLLGKLCAKEPVSSPPSCWADVALFISQLLCGFCEAVCEVSTSLLYMQARLHSPQMCGVSCGVLFLAHNKHVAAELCFCLSVLGVCSKQVRFQRRVLFSWIFCNKIAAQGDNMSMWKLPVCGICYILVSQIWRDLSSSWVITVRNKRPCFSFLAIKNAHGHNHQGVGATCTLLSCELWHVSSLRLTCADVSPTLLFWFRVFVSLCWNSSVIQPCLKLNKSSPVKQASQGMGLKVCTTIPSSPYTSVFCHDRVMMVFR